MRDVEDAVPYIHYADTLACPFTGGDAHIAPLSRAAALRAVKIFCKGTDRVVRPYRHKKEPA